MYVMYINTHSITSFSSVRHISPIYSLGIHIHKRKGLPNPGRTRCSTSSRDCKWSRTETDSPGKSGESERLPHLHSINQLSEPALAI